MHNEKTIDYLNRLNPLSYISMSIVFQDDMTIRKYYEFSQELRDLEFKWVGIRTVDNGEAWNDSGYNPVIGFNPDYSDEPFSPMRPNLQKYPMFYLHDMFANNKEVNPDNLNFMANSYEQHLNLV